MKTLKILVALISVNFLLFNYANSQAVNKSEYPELWEHRSYPCVTEPLTGTVILHHWFKDGRHLVKADGTIFGDNSGKEYTLSTNWDYIEYVPSSGQWPMYKWVQTLLLRDGNKLVAKIHQTYHATIDENGIATTIVDKYDCDCK